MAKCDLRILFDKADRAFASGEKITGTVEVCADAEVTCNALTLTREWRTHGKGNIAKGAAETVTLFQGRWSAGETVTYEFSVDAPNGPVTYHGNYLNVDWYLRARADIPWAIDAKAEEEFLLAPGKQPPSLGPSWKPPDDSGPGASSVGCILIFAGIFAAVGLGVALAGIAVLLSKGQWQGSCMIPFGAVFLLVGVGIGYASVRNTLAQRTLGPVEVSFSARELRRGEALGVSVKFEPQRVADLTRVTAKLVGRERVISGSGTNKTTHTHGLHEEKVEIDSGRRLMAGERVELSGSYTLPRDAAPTFAAEDNHLEWLVEIHFDLPGRPDWQKEYAVTILP